MTSLPLIYLCRHGQTDWNADARLQGQSDIPLNRVGLVQARRNGRYLANVLGAGGEDFAFVSSPMSRAADTMRGIRREMGLDPEAFGTDERLKEIHFGEWQGYTVPELNRLFPEQSARRDADKWNFLPPGEGAETYAGLAERIAPAFRSLDRPSVVVAHGGVTRAFLTVFAGMSPVEASHTDIPQDRILRVRDGRTDWV
ncbi:histidine phosphatase family protein [Aureimonas flava]|uniref:Histidine phosphatase family protein n=1 Tax=Aureimonas flava TaxID=2320271 RepID=A0A3A1WQQ4_9HYPH|nr:histidine phosphatase family protein [Aureimonas flava]RIY03386.1 histidine phosphatase family protein [Aureimonas flava]